MKLIRPATSARLCEYLGRARRGASTTVETPPDVSSSSSLLSMMSAASSPDDTEHLLQSIHALSAQTDMPALLRTAVSHVREQADAADCLLVLMREGQPVIEARAVATQSGIDISLPAQIATEAGLPMPLLLQAIENGVGMVIDSKGNMRRGSDVNNDVPAFCLPLTGEQGTQDVTGALVLRHTDAIRTFNVAQRRRTQWLAQQLAVSLAIARRQAHLVAENERLACAESALRASETSLKQGEQFNHTGSMRFLVREGLMLCSDELCRIYGLPLSQKEIRYEEFSTLMHPDDRDRVLETIDAAIAIAGTIRVEHRICRKDTGEVRYISGIGKPIFVNGTFTEYVGTATDVTVRRQAEYAIRVAQADLARVSRATTVGQLTSSIAHEINQPLMSIVSNAGASLRWLDRDPPQLEQAREGLRDIISEGQRAGEMIQGLQRLTRNTEPVLERVDLNAVIRHILTISRSDMERRDISLILSLAPGEACVLGDAVQLQQVLLNLIVNAIEAMAENLARTMTITSDITGDQRIAVSVQDSGEGIAQDAIAHVFDAFYTTKKNGMGMGLAICRSIVESHHGRLRVTTVQPRGTAFSFDLPQIP